MILCHSTILRQCLVSEVFGVQSDGITTERMLYLLGLNRADL